jgi:hypothetical protein
MRFRADPNDQAGAWNVVRVAKAKVLGLVRQRIEAQEATNTALEKGDVELILAALLSCTIASVRTRVLFTLPLFAELDYLAETTNHSHSRRMTRGMSSSLPSSLLSIASGVHLISSVKERTSTCRLSDSSWNNLQYGTSSAA